MTPAEEFRDLAERWCDGSLEEDRAHRLSALLAADPRLARELAARARQAVQLRQLAAPSRRRRIRVVTMAGLGACAAALVAAVMLLRVGPAAPPAPLATVEALAGDVAIDGVAAVAGDALTAGRPLEVPVGASAVLRLRDGSAVRIVGAARLAVEERDGARIRLAAGGIVVEAAEQAPGRTLRVSDQRLEVRVVGTRFRVVCGASISEVVVEHGTVDVAPIGSPQQGLRLVADQAARRVGDAGLERLAVPIALVPSLDRPRRGLHGNEWRAVSDPQASAGMAWECLAAAGQALPAAELRRRAVSWIELPVPAVPGVPYTLRIEGRTLHLGPLGEAQHHDSVHVEVGGGAFEVPGGMVPSHRVGSYPPDPDGAQRVVAYNGFAYGNPEGRYQWIAGNHDRWADREPVVVRFDGSAPARLRLIADEAPLRIAGVRLDPRR